MDFIEISADPSKYVCLPIQNEDLWQRYKMTLDTFWTVHEVDLSHDKKTIARVFDEDEQNYILQLLGVVFVAHHTVVNKLLFMQLMNEVQIKEAAYFFGSQADTKKTHCNMYSIYLDELLGNNADEKDKLIRKVLAISAVRHLISSSIQATTCEEYSFSQRLIAFASLQGIVFRSIMVLFKWLLKNNLSGLSGLAQMNNKIWQDEGIHLNFSITLFQYIEDNLDEEDAHVIVQNFVQSTKNMFKVLKPSTVRMENQDMEHFIEFSADKILSDLGMSKLYNKESTFDWFEDQNAVYRDKPKSNASDENGVEFELNTNF